MSTKEEQAQFKQAIEEYIAENNAYVENKVAELSEKCESMNNKPTVTSHEDVDVSGCQPTSLDTVK